MTEGFDPLRLGKGDSFDPGIISALVRGALFPAAVWSGSKTRFTWMNEAFRSLLQTSATDVLGLPVSGFLSDELPATLLLDAAYTGAPHVVPDYERVADDGASYWHIVLLPTLQGIGPYDVVVIAREVTSSAVAKRAKEQERDLMLGSLSLIGTTILSTMDAEDIMQRAVVEAVEAFDADWGWIAERDERGWSIRNTHGVTGGPEGRSFAEDAGSLPGLAVKAGRIVKASLTDRPSPEMAELLRAHSLDAFMLVPVFDHGVVTAVLGFCWASPIAITGDHIRVAEQLAVSLSLALGNARAYASERDLGRRLSSALFAAPERIPGLETGHLYRSASFGAHVGGDFFDLVNAGEGRIGMFVGDVSGQGMDAAPLAGAVKSLLRAEMSLNASPAQLARRANDLVLRQSDSASYTSAFLGLFEPSRRRLRYCSAGHPSPVLLRAGSTQPELLPRQQVILGVDAASSYREAHATMDVGDLLVLYTNGITSARDRSGEAYGTDRLLRAVADCGDMSAEEVPEALFLDAFSHAEGELRDDVALLALRLVAA